MRRSRRGYTLIEMLVAIAVATLAMGISGALIHSLFLIHHNHRLLMDSDREVERLTYRLRDDAVAATSISLAEPSGEAAWQLDMQLAGGESISYQHVEQLIQRRHVRPGKPVHRDTFRVGAIVDEPVIDELHGVPIATLSLRRSGETRLTAAGSNVAVVIAAGAAPSRSGEELP